MLEVPSEKYNSLDFLLVLKASLVALFRECEHSTHEWARSALAHLLTTMYINKMACSDARPYTMMGI
jgi:hypothetical protein